MRWGNDELLANRTNQIDMILGGKPTMLFFYII